MNLIRVAISLRVLVVMSLAFAGQEACADSIFKCRGADGAMHYQGSRCLQSDEVSHWTPQAAAPYTPASIVIPVDGMRGYKVKGEIEGTGVIMQVDTGASMVSVPRSLAEKLKLAHGQPQQFATANGIATGYMTVIRTLKVGDFTLQNVEAAVMNDLPGGVLLGQTALSHFKVEQARGQLRISAL
ncbi:MAG: retropepsin-like aspartic protease [Gallionella sp.]|nr:retropepsin-like aspartic protease [Gallionella sp.]